ncbi:nucleotidyltransferase family protein [bacterium]|nr:nucleotidyltransferase family protein [bacterium]
MINELNSIRISAVILAAGEGKRMGLPKALLEIDNQPLVHWLARKLLASGIDEISVVLNEQLANLEDSLTSLSSKIHTTMNRQLERGALYSFQLGLKNLNNPGTAVFLVPVDHPFFQAQTLTNLISHSRVDHIILPRYQEKRGHPPLIGSKLIDLIHTLPLESGARGLYKVVPPESIQEIAVEDPGILRNINTPSDWQHALEVYHNPDSP